MSQRPGWIGVDLDGTLAHYDQWVSIDHIGEPIMPMVNLVRELIAKGERVKIFTARMHDHGIPDHIFRRTDAITPIQNWCLKHIGTMLPVTNMKDFDMVMLYDDRCIQVERNTGRLIGNTP